VSAKKLIKFDSKRFLSTMDGGRKIAAFAKKQTSSFRAIRPMLFVIYRMER
jgi:hypothetical protein